MVGDTRESAVGGRTPVGGEDGLPNDEDADVSIGVMREDLLDCGRPPQAFGSGGGKEKDEARNAGIGVEGGGEASEIVGGERGERRLAGGDFGGPPEIEAGEGDDYENGEDDDGSFHLVNLSAMTPAISCGKRIMARTTTTAAQRKTLPRRRPRTAHCLARCCCQKPKAMRPIERPRSQGRRVVKKALAVPAPRAAAKPRGRQQPTVAIELRIAARDADAPVDCLMGRPFYARGGRQSQAQ